MLKNEFAVYDWKDDSFFAFPEIVWSFSLIDDNPRIESPISGAPMTDHLSPELRSRVMSHVRSVDTRPEMKVRRLVHGMGYRYRLHRRDLPGTPDLVFSGRRKIIFVHGCFWHQHGCRRGSRPTSNQDFWNCKLDGNILRDRASIAALERAGWSVLVIWECETKGVETVTARMDAFLRGGRSG